MMLLIFCLMAASRLLNATLGLLGMLASLLLRQRPTAA